MLEPTVTIEVVGKRGKCIRCSKPGRKRRIHAKYGKHGLHESEVLCLSCAKNMAIQMKWSVKYGNRPIGLCQGTVEMALVAGERSGPVHHHN